MARRHDPYLCPAWCTQSIVLRISKFNSNQVVINLCVCWQSNEQRFSEQIQFLVFCFVSTGWKDRAIFDWSLHWWHFCPESSKSVHIGKCSSKVNAVNAAVVSALRALQHSPSQTVVSCLLYTLQVSVAEWLARLTAVWEDPGTNHATDSCVYRDSCCDIQSWARAGHLYCSA